jgi:hypothetical protein
VSIEPLSPRHVVRFHTNRGTIVNGSGTTLLADGPSRHILVGMTDREIEVPPDSGLVDHLVDIVRNGGPVYLTRDGVRVAAVVNREVAEALAAEQEEPDPRSSAERLDILVAELDRTNGPVSQEELDEVDRTWRAALEQ